MENQIHEQIAKIASNPGVTGVVVANAHGLCIATHGKASSSAAGVINEIVNQAHKLHPEQKPPVVMLDYGEKQCLIQKNGDVVAAVYKTSKK